MPYVSLDEAVNLLRSGRVLAIPTETVYGLAGRIDSESALREIFVTKQRPFFDPLIVHVPSIREVGPLASRWPEPFQALADRFWPGPLTMVAPKTPAVSPLITSGLDTVAIRCPRHPLTLELIQTLGVPVAAPSANRFGRTSPTKPEHVDAEFAGRLAILDGGPCEVGLESTVIDAREAAGHWHIRILRPGGVSRAELGDELRRQGFRFTLERAESSVSPGHLKTHYQPASPLIITHRDFSDTEILARARDKLGSSARRVSHLKLEATPEQAARRLYQDFRDLSAIGENVIVVRKREDDQQSSWDAIWDRIERAASMTLF
jgi:L-threonylcarbamoyladenylate synthase